MNIQKIFDAVNEDEMNSPLPLIVYELEKQGYNVKIEGVDVISGDMENALFTDFERATNEFHIELYKEQTLEQSFRIVFRDYHYFSIEPVN